MLTQEIVQHKFHYDKETGKLYWKNPQTNRVKAGEEAGTYHSGYISIYIGNTQYMAHTIIWLYCTGSFPTYEIDHIDGNRANNKLENLRDVPRCVNRQNTGLGRQNTSGVTGVYWFKRTQRWMVRIKFNKTNHYGGYYKTYEDAVKKRDSMVKELNENGAAFTDTHGKRKGCLL